ncbi:VCBS repeat-containing protein, partial [bacterium]|nr:VCBS repeat-containing protein [bacterium]
MDNSSWSLKIAKVSKMDAFKKFLLVNYLIISFSTLVNAQINVTIPDQSADRGDSISIPINVSNLLGSGVYSFDIWIRFDDQVLQNVGVSTEGAIADTLNILYHCNNAEIKVSGYNIYHPLGDQRVLFYLDFVVIGRPSKTSELSFTRCIFNDDNPSANPSNGFFTVNTYPINVVITTNLAGETQVAVDGRPHPAPYQTTWNAGTEHLIGVPSPQEGFAGTRYVFVSWSDGGDQFHSVAPDSDVTYVANLEEAPLPTVWRINAGGESYVDSKGMEWEADREYSAGGYGYVGGRVYFRSDSIRNTEDDVLYQSERYKMDGYRFDLPNGSYEVQLLFAEIYCTQVGQRVFDVYIEDNLVLDDLDIYGLVGRNAALVRTFEVEVTDGTLDITFGQEIENPKISAIEVSALLPDETPPVISNVTTSNITASSVTITWDTDEAADTQVEYGLDTNYGSTTTLDTNLITSHVQEITGLLANTTYHYRVISRDAAGNLAVSNDQTFKTNIADLTFTDITISAGTGGPMEPGRTGGHAAIFADVDSDGKVDLYITMRFDNPMADLFFRNIGGNVFVDEGALRGIDDFDGGSHGACFADLDNDGDYDLYNGTTDRVAGLPPAINNIFRNDGSGYFTDVTASSGIPVREWPTRAVLAFDMESDGDLDLFCVTNYLGTNDPADERNEVYRNDGNMQFTAINSGVLYIAPAGQGATDTDYDGDGDIDVIAANRTGPLNIMRNDGQGNFTLIAPSSIGIMYQGRDGITMADVDNDGDLDMLLVGDPNGYLYLNNGNGTFTFKRSFSGTEGYMGGFADLDNDGDLDLVFAGDDICYLNDGLGNFSEGPTIPVSGINDPRAIAFADIDNDGDLDFAIGCKRSRNWLIRNNFNSGNWLKVRLISPQGQAGAFGAKTRIYPPGQAGGTLLGMRESRSNNGYLGQDDPVLHFGLGEYTSVDVVVTFLDGSTATRTNVAACQTITINGCDVPPRFHLTVNNGSGDGNYPAGTVVNIFANPPPPNYVFDQWTGDIEGIANVDSDTTTLVMPAADVIITATYKARMFIPYLQRVNSGGDTYTDSKGNVWSADQAYTSGSWGYVGGRTYSRSVPIANTTDDQLYQSERYRMSAYRFTVPNGRYRVDLHFAEIYCSRVGQRIFDVYIEDNLVLDDFDIYALVGRNAALVR